MARPRTELSNVLHAICNNVYFQPPNGYKLTYPCIVYELEKTDVTYADNAPYALYDLYSIKYITRDPDDATRYQFVLLPRCKNSRMYVADNLYHHPFDIYW